MEARLLRTGSIPLRSPALPGSPKVHLSRHGSGVFSGERTSSSSKTSLHLEMNGRRDRAPIRRVMSDSDVIRLTSSVFGGSRCFQSRIPEEECVSDGEVDDLLSFMSRGVDWPSYTPIAPEYSIPTDEFGISGNGKGRSGNDDRKSGDGNGDGRFGDRSKIGDHYREMLKLNPGDSLLLRNYGKYMYEVEKDVEKAEEYFGRAILASPGDGEVLSLYGKLIWETQRDEGRAKSYFDRAVCASPDDCMVLGSYARFMWESEEDEDEEEVGVSPAMVAAF
ncbi:hypothetical protein SLEP1_g22005 [Rubroshorea leprosula]|uniref:TmcB/TmcC TPR repeats domain-containing protein n=1 Tax=Rubroshorea leprosula TaxID=152421 RepID=A0AAV5JJW0_9ROSI|nr:hypothetical protein SLEP1_g22005 [Rubroshorea leprosula]